MPEIIVPMTQIQDTAKVAEFAREINALVKTPEMTHQLRTRHLLGVLARHSGDADSSFRHVSRARNAHYARELGVFALFGNNDVVLGMATVDPDARLRRQRLNMPPFIARGPAAYNIHTRGPEVAAWAVPGAAGSRALAEAYKQLSSPEGPASALYELYATDHNLKGTEAVLAWTIEPLDTPPWVHKAIQAGGFERQDRGHYDDFESRTSAPPMSAFYQVAP